MEIGDEPSLNSWADRHRHLTELTEEHGLIDVHVFAYGDRACLRLANETTTLDVTFSRAFLSGLWEMMADLDAGVPDDRASSG